MTAPQGVPWTPQQLLHMLVLSLVAGKLAWILLQLETVAVDLGVCVGRAVWTPTVVQVMCDMCCCGSSGSTAGIVLVDSVYYWIYTYTLQAACSSMLQSVMLK